MLEAWSTPFLDLKAHCFYVKFSALVGCSTPIKKKKNNYVNNKYCMKSLKFTDSSKIIPNMLIYA
jgi:hypothetical protein